MQKVAVGLVTFNRAHMIREAVLASAHQTYKPFRIFVIDNASTDKTQSVLAQLIDEFPDLADVVVPVLNSSNEGSAGGFHLAAKKGAESGADWVWLMDDDAIPQPETLSKLMASSVVDHTSTGALGCLVIDEQGDVFPPNNQCKLNKVNFEFQPIDLKTAIEQNKPVESHTNSFDGFLISKKAILECGYPDKTFFTWYDDIDYSMRISEKFKIWVIPNARIIHKGQLRSEEKNHWPFKAKLATYDWNGCWRMFYRSRNYYLLSRRFSVSSRYHKNFAKHLLKEMLAPVLFKQDRLVSRWRLSLKAAYEGYFNVRGKTVDIKPPFKSI